MGARPRPQIFMEEKRHAQWLEFVTACKPFWEACPFKEKLIAACAGKEDIAIVAYFHHGASALEWLEGEVPFLNGAKPGAILKRGRGDRVRECLWRTP
jgi:hypothetical protein